MKYCSMAFFHGKDGGCLKGLEGFRELDPFIEHTCAGLTANWLGDSRADWEARLAACPGASSVPSFLRRRGTKSRTIHSKIFLSLICIYTLIVCLDARQLMACAFLRFAHSLDHKATATTLPLSGTP